MIFITEPIKAAQLVQDKNANYGCWNSHYRNLRWLQLVTLLWHEEHGLLIERLSLSFCSSGTSCAQDRARCSKQYARQVATALHMVGGKKISPYAVSKAMGSG